MLIVLSFFLAHSDKWLPATLSLSLSAQQVNVRKSLYSLAGEVGEGGGGAKSHDRKKRGALSIFLFRVPNSPALE